jgi:hypothetical protein
MAEHLVADDDGRYRYRYSREAARPLWRRGPPRNAAVRRAVPDHADSRPRVALADRRRRRGGLRRVRRLRVEEVPGGHVVLWDAMAETSALVRDFLVAKDRTA